MPFTLGTKKVEPPSVKKQKKAEAKAKEAKDKMLYKRRKESEALLFGSELFEPIIKKEKEVIIHFPENCTNEGIFISKCGKFGYQHCQNGFFFNLFYFIDAILDWSADLVIIPSETIWIFDSLTPEELEDLAIRLRRAEYAEEKRKVLEEIKELERQRKEELDKADAEFELEQEASGPEQLVFETQMIPDTNIEITTVTNERECITEVVSSRIIEVQSEPTLNEVSAIEAKNETEKSEIKVIKSAFVPLQFGKVNKK